MTLEIGHKAPDFSCLADDGKTYALSDFKGKKLVLYFYPKDDTPGCTSQACDFRDQHPEFSKLNVVVLGVSKDSAKSHDKFRAKYQLNFPLLIDEDLKICEAYGVWKEKSMYGRTFLAINRSTFLIDEEGKIQRIWRSVKVKGHVNEVLGALG
jgi:peroxiredoxin Q/BCP